MVYRWFPKASWTQYIGPEGLVNQPAHILSLDKLQNLHNSKTTELS